MSGGTSDYEELPEDASGRNLTEQLRNTSVDAITPLDQAKDAYDTDLVNGSAKDPDGSFQARDARLSEVERSWKQLKDAELEIIRTLQELDADLRRMKLERGGAR
ncbi:hypothetical protein [Leucobacter sp. wl10]|uniref:hypothetical protein n=1 Tax=Leucobacter sp. wl10 TaxID=2304677 RepID=UPI0013C2D76E|nr:hypothetical protein [Leucobacter sp. wl10]